MQKSCFSSNDFGFLAPGAVHLLSYQYDDFDSFPLFSLRLLKRMPRHQVPTNWRAAPLVLVPEASSIKYQGDLTIEAIMV
jgi:hypothetical protein